MALLSGAHSYIEAYRRSLRIFGTRSVVARCEGLHTPVPPYGGLKVTQQRCNGLGYKTLGSMAQRTQSAGNGLVGCAACTEPWTLLPALGFLQNDQEDRE